jgi:hypothetical protein
MGYPIDIVRKLESEHQMQQHADIAEGGGHSDLLSTEAGTCYVAFVWNVPTHSFLLYSQPTSGASIDDRHSRR